MKIIKGFLIIMGLAFTGIITLGLVISCGYGDDYKIFPGKKD